MRCRKTGTRMQSGRHHITGRIRAEYTSEGKISLVYFLRREKISGQIDNTVRLKNLVLACSLTSDVSRVRSSIQKQSDTRRLKIEGISNFQFPTSLEY